MWRGLYLAADGSTAPKNWFYNARLWAVSEEWWKVQVSRDVALCRSVGGSRHFEVPFCLPIQGPSSPRWIATRLHYLALEEQLTTRHTGTWHIPEHWFFNHRYMIRQRTVFKMKLIPWFRMHWEADSSSPALYSEGLRFRIAVPAILKSEVITAMTMQTDVFWKYDAVWSGRNVRTFQMNVLPTSIQLKVAEIRFAPRIFPWSYITFMFDFKNYVIKIK
jgi:hypothetical protein